MRILVLSALLVLYAAHAAEDTRLTVVTKRAGSIGEFGRDVISTATDGGAKFVERTTVGQLIDEVSSGKADAAVAAVSVTSSREESVDFVPYMSAGQGILIRRDLRPSYLNGLMDFGGFVIRKLLQLLAFVIVVAHFVWLAERGSPNIDDDYRTGIFQSVWFIYVSLTTIGYGDITPKKWVSRTIVVVATLFGFSFFASIVSEMSVDKIERRLEYSIRSERDLAGRRCATVGGTSCVDSIARHGGTAIECEGLRDAYARLILGEVDCVVYDRPMLKDFISEIQSADTVLLDREFDVQGYGIVVQQGSPLREHLVRRILQMQEDGTMTSLRRRHGLQE